MTSLGCRGAQSIPPQASLAEGTGASATALVPLCFSHCCSQSCSLAKPEGPLRLPIQFYPLIFTNEEVTTWRDQVTGSGQDFDVAAEVSHNLNMSRWLVVCLKRDHFSAADAALSPLSVPDVFLCAT